MSKYIAMVTREYGTGLTGLVWDDLHSAHRHFDQVNCKETQKIEIYRVTSTEVERVSVGRTPQGIQWEML